MSETEKFSPDQRADGISPARPGRDFPGEPPGLEAEDSARASDSPAAESEDDLLEFAREDALDFLEGLLEAASLDGEVSVEISEGGIMASIRGEDLAILIGRHGQTLAAVQELLRAAVQHQAQERVRLTLDIEGYRERRREALGRHAKDIAQRVLDEKKEIELDPMPAFERKVVHDAVGEVEGVTSFSEGEEPNRRVIIRPAADD